MTSPSTAEIIATIDRAKAYLRQLQRADGGYARRQDEVSEAWGTAECALALSVPDVTPSALRGLSWLRNNVRPDGGWSSGAYGNINRGKSDVAATAYALRALGSCGTAEDRRLLEAGRDWLVERQRPDGSWGIARSDEARGHIGQTGYALSALARTPTDHRAAEAIQAALYHLYEEQRAAGGWGLAPGHETDTTLTAYALRGIIDIAALRGQLPQPRILLRWLEAVEQSQRADGSWPDWYGNASSVEATGYVVEIAACIGAIPSIEGQSRPWITRALSFLTKTQHETGGWGTSGGEQPSHWVTHSVVIAIGALLGQATHIAAEFNIFSNSADQAQLKLEKAGVPRYNFAISFARSQRDYARSLALKLQQRGGSVFFDTFETAELWGTNLLDRLSHIYRTDAEFCIMIISEDYHDRAWPRLERQNAQARALLANEDYILPIRARGSLATGILDTVAFLDAELYDVDEIATLAMRRLAASTRPIDQ